MARTALSILARAGQIAKVGNISATGVFTGYASQALDELNDILDNLCQTVDFSAAMKTFDFTMATNLVSAGGGNIVTGAPNALPLDYLRVQTSGGVTGAQRSSKWYLNGVPYDMVELDLTELDDQVQQAGIQSYPYFWAKDMSQRAVVVNFQGNVAPGSTTVGNLVNAAPSGVASPVNSISVGMSLAGGVGGVPLIAPGATITQVAGGFGSLTMSVPPLNPLNSTLTSAGVSLMAGYPPVGIPYPPPSGAFNTRIRYQSLMPPLTQAQVNNGAYCWFDDDDYLIEKLAEKLMAYSGDERRPEFERRASERLGAYTKFADDRANRAQAVQLDRRSFGGKFSGLHNTKKVGW